MGLGGGQEEDAVWGWQLNSGSGNIGKGEGNPNMAEEPRGNWVHLNVVKWMLSAIRQKVKLGITIKFSYRNEKQVPFLVHAYIRLANLYVLCISKQWPLPMGTTARGDTGMPQIGTFAQVSVLLQETALDCLKWCVPWFSEPFVGKYVAQRRFLPLGSHSLGKLTFMKQETIQD